ncbi:MAG: hypothetical protein HQ541_21410, partial [Mariniphaga sp.]|nr:hypothetical protein [Mariniphaga sp.]
NKDKIENISRIIEVDGPHHEFWQYRIYDKYRDAVAEIEGFETLRVPVTEIKQDNKLINSLFKSPIYVLFEKNYNRNLKEFIDEYILIFSPVAIARIQKTLIEYFLTNLEILKQPKINIAIIERDVPCGALSIENLDEYFTNLNALLRDGSKLELPKIELTIFPDNRFLKYTSLHLKAKIGNEIYFNKNSENYDIIIDHSILRRSCIYKENNYLTDNKIIIRSSHYSDNSFGNSRRVYCAEPLQYKPLVKKQNDGSYSPVTQIEKNINFFI